MLLLAAHFYRADLPVVSFAAVALPLLLFVRAAWVARAFQVVLVLGALEWFRTMYVIAQMRIAFEQPWTRMALILGAVALFTAISALLFETRGIRRRYGHGAIS